MPFGLLNISKPAALSSRDVVNRVQRIVRPARAGHAGTLDPLATGVLVVCIGPATRLVPYVQRMSKRYLATFQLGRYSDTEDIEGQVIEVADARVPQLNELATALQQHIGTIEQRPPAYSALKVEGQRAYARARRGESLDLTPRAVRIDSIELLAYNYPELRLEVTCGSGTYIRSLGRDIAAAVGTAAVMSGLVRTAIGPFAVECAVTLAQIADHGIEPYLLNPLQAVPDLPCIQVTPSQVVELSHGRPLDLNQADGITEIVATDAADRLLALLTQRPDGHWWPFRNFLAAGE